MLMNSPTLTSCAAACCWAALQRDWRWQARRRRRLSRVRSVQTLSHDCWAISRCQNPQRNDQQGLYALDADRR